MIYVCLETRWWIWLPIRRRVTFKVATLVYKCLHGCAPVYLADDCVAVSSIPGRRFLRSPNLACNLRSTAHLELTIAYREQEQWLPFRVPFLCVDGGPTVWNSLPCTLSSPELSYITVFERNFKLNCSWKAASVICAPLMCSSINCAPTCSGGSRGPQGAMAPQTMDKFFFHTQWYKSPIDFLNNETHRNCLNRYFNN